ncbi:MAG: flagellar assembly protein T N-terminal domain-containing protein [Alphaproteobacteria bacterium]|nr:flagellar assembly protein T N-terminal domain-containing protein [Alphaproteobacteria bacterium]
MRLGILLLFVWTVLMTIFLPQLAVSKVMQATGFPSVNMVTVTGRAVIQHEDTVDEARDLALEDALYYAALEGGAKIDGYSAVDETTSLQEMFIVRPASRILDYTITNELRDETHYEVTIQAVIGDVSANGCQNRPISHVTLFKPHHKLAYDLPHWMSQIPASLSHEIANALSEQPTLRVNDARTTERPAATTPSNNFNRFDYRHLTTGRVEMRQGDVGIETHVNITYESTAELLSKTHFAILNIDSFLSAPGSRAEAQKVSNVFKIKLGKKNLLYSLTTLNRESRESIQKLIGNAASVHAKKLAETVICAPMKAQLELVGDSLQVRLGTRQGLGPNHLAFTDDKTTKFKILRVSQAGDTNVVLEPLDRRQDLAELAGAEVTFLEFNTWP